MFARYLSRPVIWVVGSVAGCCCVGCAPGSTEQSPSAIAASGSTASVPIDQGELALDAASVTTNADAATQTSEPSLATQPGADTADGDAGTGAAVDAASAPPAPPPANCDFADGGCVVHCNGT